MKNKIEKIIVYNSLFHQTKTKKLNLPIRPTVKKLQDEAIKAI